MNFHSDAAERPAPAWKTIPAIIMKTLTSIFLVLTIFGCRPTKNNPQSLHVNSNLMFGKWELDSASNSHWYGDRIFIQKDSTMFWFSGTDGGSLFSSGLWNGKDTLELKLEQKMRINLLDSNRIHVSGGWNNVDLYFDRTESGQLSEYLVHDSLRTLIVGWWKLRPMKNQIKLMNYSGWFTRFTLNIDDYGHATFYLDNNYDSTVTYSYRMNLDGISLGLGCLVSDSPLWLDQDKRLKFLLNRNDIDTLIFTRLTDIK